mgnify:CR=1 FL=1
MATTTLLTIEDFERLPSDQAKNHELVEGELVDVSGNTMDHNALRELLVEILRPIVREHRLGKVLSEQEYDFGGNAHGPDVSFFSRAKQLLTNRRLRVQRFVPDLAIEIASQHDTMRMLMRKKDRYLACGTQEVWIIEQESADIFIFSDRGHRILKGNDTIETELIPGFSITVAEIFQRLEQA